MDFAEWRQSSCTRASIWAYWLPGRKIGKGEGKMKLGGDGSELHGRSDQRFGPKLPLDKTNFKIAEAGISENSDTSIIGFLIIRDRRVARVGQTHKK
jgi:hypothetical protein